MIEQEISRETGPKMLFERAIEAGEREHEQVLITRFEQDPNPYNNQDYHTIDHAHAVSRRAKLILTRMHEADPSLVTERDIQLAGYIAKGHDRVQDWDPQVVKVGDFWVMKRRRHLGDNERDTAKEMITYMDVVNNMHGVEVFTLQDMLRVVEAEDCTIPTFEPALMTVVQKSLTKDTSPVARAVALADLGSAGMDGPREFTSEGRSLFREENLDVREAILRGYPLTKEWRDYIAWRIIGWGDSQEKWIQGRKDMLEIELEGLPENVKDAVRPLFTMFDINGEAAKKIGRFRRGLSFNQLIAETGYLKAA